MRSEKYEPKSICLTFRSLSGLFLFFVNCLFLFLFFVSYNFSLTNIFFGKFSAKTFQRRSWYWCWRASYIKTPSLGILWALSGKNTFEANTIVTKDSIISQHESSGAGFYFFIERFAVKTVFIIILETGLPPPHHLTCDRKVKVNIWITLIKEVLKTSPYRAWLLLSINKI